MKKLTLLPADIDSCPDGDYFIAMERAGRTSYEVVFKITLYGEVSWNSDYGYGHHISREVIVGAWHLPK